MEIKQLKDYYNRQFVEDLAAAIACEYSDFESDRFILSVLNEQWDEFELKQRMFHITNNIHKFLPEDYEKAIEILWNIPEKLTNYKMSGLLLMFFPDFVEKYGIDNWDLSIKALKHFTKTSSSEFAVRAFIMKDKEKMMQQMLKWSMNDNYHVRRLSSEGCRPRLPWACALPEFKENPLPIIPILENLKNDSEDYVRKSVANNLNDISKDNPDIVIDISRKWYGRNKFTDRIVKHACRTMLKQGRNDVMSIFGFKKAEIVSSYISVIPNKVKIGDDAVIKIEVDFGNEKVEKIRLEYIIHYVKKDGGYSKKVFQIAEKENISGKVNLTKKHSFVQMSTRKHYKGKHEIELVINGDISASYGFILT